MKAKTRVLSGVNPSDAVAKGDAELGFTQMSEIIGVPGVELAGPLPPEVQVYTVWSAAVNKDAKDAPAALAFIRFLTTPGAVLLIKAKGMEPGS
jgi:molybdate transport system substrate-binding protein